VYRTSNLAIALLFIVLAAMVAWGQTSAKPANTRGATTNEDFDTAIKRLRETWVQEFNAGHAEKVAALYTQEAVLMRRNGSVHSRDSILAELQGSISADAHNYVVQSLHSEHTEDFGYDTGIYNEDFPHHVSEGNYLMGSKGSKESGRSWRMPPCPIHARSSIGWHPPSALLKSISAYEPHLV
jgi:hypothetical protein